MKIDNRTVDCKCMRTKKGNNLELLLTKLDKEQLCEFIKHECAKDRQFKQRFLALGEGTLFTPRYTDYQSQIKELIDEYGGKYGFVEYDKAFYLNRAVCAILDGADVAMDNHKWNVAIAILEGTATIGEDILYCGDDSAGELGNILDECFEKWHKLCSYELLPTEIKSVVFDLAIKYFTNGCLKEFNWWWDWIQMAVVLADTSEKQECVIKVLDNVINAKTGDEWSIKYNKETAQRFKLKIISKSGTPEEQLKFMYDNVGNPDFRRKLLQMAWDKGDYDEVLRLAEEGVSRNSEYIGLVDCWYKWELMVYRHNNDRANILKISKYFFLHGGLLDEKEYSVEAMYALMKSVVPNDEWEDFVSTLIKEVSTNNTKVSVLFIYTQEKMWECYMEYLRNNISVYNIDGAPREIWKLYRDELIPLYALCVRRFFQQASSRTSYREGVKLLRKLIKYGGKKETAEIVDEQRNRTPRRPALIDELSKLKLT